MPYVLEHSPSAGPGQMLETDKSPRQQEGMSYGGDVGGEMSPEGDVLKGRLERALPAQRQQSCQSHSGSVQSGYREDQRGVWGVLVPGSWTVC